MSAGRGTRDDRTRDHGVRELAAGGDGARPTRAEALALDPIACVGHGLCAELFPEGIVLDDWGFPIVLPEASDPALRAHARRAARACPALALRLRAEHRGRTGSTSPQAPSPAPGSSQPAPRS